MRPTSALHALQIVGHFHLLNILLNAKKKKKKKNQPRNMLTRRRRKFDKISPHNSDEEGYGNMSLLL